MLKKYRAPSIVVLCLTIVLVVFQNCGSGGGGGGSLSSSSQTDALDLINIEGEYFLAYDQSSLVYLKIDRNDFSLESLKNNGGGQALYQENEGNITIVGKNKFKIDYIRESCNPVGGEIFKIKPGTIAGTLALETTNGNQYVFYDVSKYTLPVWVTERIEDSSCSFEKFGGAGSSYTSEPYVVSTVKGYLDVQQPIVLVGSTTYQISQNSYEVITQAFQVAQQQGIQPTMVNGAQKYKAKITGSLQSGYQQQGGYPQQGSTGQILNVTQAVIYR